MYATLFMSQVFDYIEFDDYGPTTLIQLFYQIHLGFLLTGILVSDKEYHFIPPKL